MLRCRRTFQRWDGVAVVVAGDRGVWERVNYSSPLEMQTTAEAREPPPLCRSLPISHGHRAAGEREVLK